MDNKEQHEPIKPWLHIALPSCIQYCPKCNYRVFDINFKTPNCPWCGKEMTNFPWEDDDDDSESNNT